MDKMNSFDSVEELNAYAAELKAAGDKAKLVELAKDNGLDAEDAEDYFDGYVEEFCGVTMAGIGKLKSEADDLELKGILLDWVAELNLLCTENSDFARAARSKSKSLAEYIARLMDYSFENAVTVPKEIVERTVKVKKACGTHGLTIGTPDKKTRREIARKYFLGM